MALVTTLVDAAFMDSGFEAVACDDTVNKLFPEGTGFRMTLEGVLDWENHVAVEGDTMASLVPIGVLIVNENKRRLVWRWRVRVGIGGIDL